MISVSIIVPSYNSFQTIGRTLDSIFCLNLLDQVKDIIIVDSSDDPGTREIFKRYPEGKLKTILLDSKTSPANGRNTGVKHAQGDLLCFIDSDVFLDPDWLANILRAHDTGCLAGCGSVAAPDFQQNSKLALAQLYLQFNESLDIGQTRAVKMVPACNMFIEKGLFEKAGGFPDLRASEDVILCLKVGELSRVWFVPAAKCFHIFRESPESYYNNQKVLGKYIIIYRRITYKKWYYIGLWPLILLPGFLLIKIFRIQCRIYKAGWAHTKKFIFSLPLFLAGFWCWADGFRQGCLSKE